MLRFEGESACGLSQAWGARRPTSIIAPLYLRTSVSHERLRDVSEDQWRPLGVDDEDEIASYDALHDDVPTWMATAYWAWVRKTIAVSRTRRTDSYLTPYSAQMLDTDLVEVMCQRLRINLPNLRTDFVDYTAGKEQLKRAMGVLRQHSEPLQIADYLLAHGNRVDRDLLDRVLWDSRSAWRVGERFGRPGLVRRVPEGVQIAADSVMARAGRAGVRLSRAWGELYGVDPSPSEAYRLAILAVEDAAVPVVSSSNSKATLGTVLKQIEEQNGWGLPMDREHEKAPSGDVLVSMIRMLWHGQHDRHGGQPSSPGDVSLNEATIAVNIAVTLVSWFSAGLVSRAAQLK